MIKILISDLFRSWAAPLAICCLLFMLALVAATIIIALIPLYLSTKDVTVANPSIFLIIIIMSQIYFSS